MTLKSILGLSLAMGLSLLWTPAGQLLVKPNLSRHGNWLQMSVAGLPTNAICDLLVSTELGEGARWELYFRGAPGQTNFLLTLPESARGFIRAASILEPVVTIDAADLDADGLVKEAEQLAGTDPLHADSDGDDVPDGLDLFPLDSTRWRDLPGAPDDRSAPIITLLQPARAVLLP
jgi:hypothetical protein